MAQQQAIAQAQQIAEAGKTASDIRPEGSIIESLLGTGATG
jgi:hypothetical protein